MYFSRIILCFVLFYQGSSTVVLDTQKEFVYFAYGSNLLDRRIHVHNPTARFFGVAMLPGYRLDFNTYMKSWNGAVATIAADPDSHVWGTLWILDISDLKHLDEQEGVPEGLYYAMNVNVVAGDGSVYIARTYREPTDPPKVPSYELPPERQPSNTYMQVIILGAIENLLPLEYIKYLFTFPTNGALASWSMRQSLGYPFNVMNYNFYNQYAI